MEAVLSLNNEASDPLYNPENIDLKSNYNVLEVSEIHAFQDTENFQWSQHDREYYRRKVGDQLQKFADFYEADEIWILGDTGSTDDLLGVLSRLEEDQPVTVVAGDEDKVSYDEEKKPWTGFFEQIDAPQPYDLDIDYMIRDECFDTDIEDFYVQASHHPVRSDRSKIQPPDPRSPNAADDFFSVEKDLNSEIVKGLSTDPHSEAILPSLTGVDAVFYDHVHMPYPREIQGTAVIGLGGRRNNYQRGAECIPKSSLHLSSFDKDILHQLQFDAETEEINEHVVFEKEGGDMNMYDGAHLGENGPGFYKPVQTRFHPDHFRPEARETGEDIKPPLWSQREEN